MSRQYHVVVTSGTCRMGVSLAFCVFVYGNHMYIFCLPLAFLSHNHSRFAFSLLNFARALLCDLIHCRYISCAFYFYLRGTAFVFPSSANPIIADRNDTTDNSKR